MQMFQRFAAAAALVLATMLALPFPGKASDPDPELDAQIGQMLLVGFKGTSPDSPGARRVAQQIAGGRIGGVILMDRNVRSPQQVRALTAKFLGTGQPITPLVSVDQEGGLVQRLSARKGFTAYPTARSMAKRYTPGKAQEKYKAMAEELAAAGFNMNFGPVLDLSINRRNKVITRRGRSYGDAPDRVTAYARAFIQAHREANVLTSVKHFPGHGSSRADSHDRRVDLSKTWKDVELEPYRALERTGEIDTIMVGHLFLPVFKSDRKEKLPATLSPTAIEGWLRLRLGFQGVVITDDLNMGAIRKYHNLRETLIKSVLSGNDILLFSRAGEDAGFVPRATEILRNAVREGIIPRRRIEESYERIVRLKKHLKPGRVAIDATMTGLTP